MPWPAHCRPVLTPADEYSRISVTPIAGALGAEISGVDISRSIDDATFAEIRRAWTQNLVNFFRGQSLDDDALVAFGSVASRRCSAIPIC